MNSITFTAQILKELYEALDRHLAEDAAPSEYLETLAFDPDFKEYPFSLLSELRFAEQSPLFHPEGNVWKHTLLVVDEAAKRRSASKEPKALMLSALLHDIGKPATSRRKNGRITAYDHDRVGAELAESFLSVFTKDRDFIEKVVYLIRYHMQPLYVSKRRELLDLKGIRERGEASELALLCLCDRLGRFGASIAQGEEQADLFLKLVENKEKV